MQSRTLQLPYINACDPLVAATTQKWDLSDTTLALH
jgi:hypothetical protein